MPKSLSAVYMMDERLLIDNVLKGDLKAFETLIKQYERLVFTVSSRLINDQSDLEDICQEVFVKVHRRLGGFRLESKLSTWIARIAYHTAINYLKKYRKQVMVPLTEENEEGKFRIEDDIDRRDLSRYLEKLIAQLPFNYRTVITLFHSEGFSYKEIGSVTGFPEGTVKIYLFRARQLLKENLIKYET